MPKVGSLALAFMLIVVGVLFSSGLLIAIVELVIRLTGVALIVGGVVMGFLVLSRGGRRRGY